MLADGYDRVTVVERDQLPARVTQRRGVPQGRHLHALLPSGCGVVGELFPGLLDELVGAGGTKLADYRRMHFLPDGTHRLSPDLVLEPVYQPSRPLLETGVRARVRGLSNVEFRDGCEAVGLVTDESRGRVTGARVVDHGGRAEEVLAADLVVDATGRGSRTPAWLAALGYERPAQDEVVVDVRYVSRLVRLPPGAVPEVLVVIGASPERPAGMGLFAYEDDTWMFTVSGYGGHNPAPDYESMVDVVAGFAPPHLVAALREAEPLDDVSTFRFRANRRLRYDRMRRAERLLVFGDAMCGVNPIYGQGMSVAALEALELRKCLRRGDRDLARRFFRAAAKPVGVAWRLAVGADLALPQVDGPRPLPVRLVSSYVSRLLVAAEHDPVVAERFLRVSAFLMRPPTIMSPRIVARVVAGNRRARRVTPEPAMPESAKAGTHGT
ncbi:NAD(P)/FAD-dependent oxidoreductase [Actinophytocola sp.]|uniref:NAD(P)/FAD-dependent oxidoreductase n=1 Tax=Actinophytocola sp. TaxID=1872138 RepID=UPI003D6C1AC7